MFFFSTTKGTVIVNHWNCRGTRRNPAWDTPLGGEKCVGLVSLKLLQESFLRVSLTGKPQNTPLEAHRLLWVPQCRSIHSPAHPSGFRHSQRNPLLS